MPNTMISILLQAGGLHALSQCHQQGRSTTNNSTGFEELKHNPSTQRWSNICLLQGHTARQGEGALLLLAHTGVHQQQVHTPGTVLPVSAAA